MTYNTETEAYETTITAPSTSSHGQENGYYPVSVTAYDEYGNTSTVTTSDETFGDNLKLVVTEEVPPIITITSPTDDAVIGNNTPTISWTCFDEDSGVDASTIAMKLDDVEVEGIATSVNAGVYTCSYIPSTALEPENNYKTNQASVTVTGVTNDLFLSSVVVTVNGEVVEVSATGTFSTGVPISEGENLITITATDGVGQSTTITRMVLVNTTGSSITNVDINPNPVKAGALFDVTVEVVENGSQQDID